MPIGLSDDGPRACDVAARKLMGRAGSSVFPAPLRPVLACASYEEACAVSRAASGKALSVQAWNLVPAIRSLDEALGDPPDPRVHEAFPELAFRALDEKVASPKATARGRAERIRALEPVLDVLDALAEAPAGVPAVDCLDACAVAWSARRIAEGSASSVGGDERDAGARRGGGAGPRARGGRRVVGGRGRARRRRPPEGDGVVARAPVPRRRGGSGTPFSGAAAARHGHCGT